MELIIVVILLVFILIISFFIFPQLSIIPYYPTNPKDLKQISSILDIKNNQSIIDLGAGDGMVVFSLASYAYIHKLSTKFVAIEINPVLVLILQIRRFFHPNKKNIKIMKADIFKLDYSNWKSTNPVFYIYISPWLIKKLIKKIQQGVKNFTLVSYMYEAKQHKPKKITKGIHKTYLYDIKSKP